MCMSWAHFEMMIYFWKEWFKLFVIVVGTLTSSAKRVFSIDTIIAIRSDLSMWRHIPFVVFKYWLSSFRKSMLEVSPTPSMGLKNLQSTASGWWLTTSMDQESPQMMWWPKPFLLVRTVGDVHRRWSSDINKSTWFWNCCEIERSVTDLFPFFACAYSTKCPTTECDGRGSELKGKVVTAEQSSKGQCAAGGESILGCKKKGILVFLTS